MKVIYVGLAGFAGALSRYGLSFIWNEGPGRFPWGTLACNLLGCLLLGYLSTAVLINWKPDLRLAVTAGFIGAFTTFSAFSLEIVQLTASGRSGIAVVYGLVSLWGGLLFTWIGMAAAGKRKEVDRA
ncbi:fluoride efflux transporter CrcB [Paenibacillus sp. FJAT-26967]|uniref:fluoride efflux transporter CrcB n=1 Tax=Paenibacillus sp. FJAT-26967 TaxID=1729690 RepID=UPI0008393A93|nr:fluoride efflux transporter CrcB [Paenibacillus sp. FJAT-26967]